MHTHTRSHMHVHAQTVNKTKATHAQACASPEISFRLRVTEDKAEEGRGTGNRTVLLMASNKMTRQLRSILQPCANYNHRHISALHALLHNQAHSHSLTHMHKYVTEFSCWMAHCSFYQHRKKLLEQNHVLPPQRVFLC